MAKKIQESKEKKAAKHSSSKEKKKWTGPAKKEEQRRLVVVTDDLLAKIEKEVVKLSLVTRYSLAAKYNLSLCVAGRVLEYCANKGLVKRTLKSGPLCCYVKPGTPEVQPEAAPVAENESAEWDEE